MCCVLALVAFNKINFKKGGNQLINWSQSGLSFIDVFVLHSQIPLEDQSNAFVAPAPNRMNILLATNLAESSVTIPSLRLVINTALQQYSHFDSVQQMSVLRKMWASKAARSQRAGRAGREFPGVVIHTIPRSLYTLLQTFPNLKCPPLHWTNCTYQPGISDHFSELSRHQDSFSLLHLHQCRPS